MKTKWSIALFALMIIDSIFTVFIGEEGHPLILWAMSTFDLNLIEVMVYRLIYLIPFVFIIDRCDFSKIMFFIYIGVYILGFISQLWWM